MSRRASLASSLLALIASGLLLGGTAHAEGFTAEDTLSAISEASAQTGVSAAWLERVVSCETGGTFDPYAVGDGGTSYGIAQLHKGGGELPRFYAAGFSDVFDPYQASDFLASELAAGRAASWSCR